MSIWSSKIIEELAYNRVIIFFGSGVSACAKKRMVVLQKRGESLLQIFRL